ncbi:hypothetical protein PAPYR_11905 [Paratrimastix pyriformis]|uniref:Uncharacterized protein n=1 Tax=Paratrimastix pyriformis TaxID=342808 RepID=A0ABQ8U9U4_9EUKA|nr:hypothetical protein PAPYR_11905 [Paratrimastix pyriformis]
MCDVEVSSRGRPRSVPRSAKVTAEVGQGQQPRVGTEVGDSVVQKLSRRVVAGCRCRLAFCRCACHPGGRRLRVAASRCLRGLCREWPARVPAVLGALAADAARAACAACAACTAWPLSAFAGLAGLWAFVSAACVVFRAVRFPDGPVDAFCCSACLAGRTPGGAPCGAPGTRSLPASGRFAGWPIARLAGAISTAAGAMER